MYNKQFIFYITSKATAVAPYKIVNARIHLTHCWRTEQPGLAVRVIVAISMILWTFV